MAVHQKLSEIGWFYHAPELHPSTDLRALPLTSQVPGLNDFSMLPPEPEKEQVFRDTDTKYIRLAKMGGRQDLLRHKEGSGASKDPQSYPRVDWYYLEDNALEDAEKKDRSAWKFRLPEYMVHDEFKPNGDDDDDGIYQHRRLPYAYDTKSAYERDDFPHAGAELKRIRQKKIKFAKGDMPAKSAPDRRKTQDGNNPPLPPLYNAVEKPMMSKIMSWGYENEWKNVRDDWYSKTKMLESKFDAATKSHLRQQSGLLEKGTPGKRVMYNDFIGSKKKSQTAKEGRRPDAVTKATAPPAPKEEKAPFKLSRFNKIPAKVSTH